MSPDTNIAVALGEEPIEPAPRPLRRIQSAPSWRALDAPDARLIGLTRNLARSIRSRPLASIGIALGMGFLIGGALSFRAGRLALSVGARHAFREFLKQIL